MLPCGRAGLSLQQPVALTGLLLPSSVPGMYASVELGFPLWFVSVLGKQDLLFKRFAMV